VGNSSVDIGIVTLEKTPRTEELLKVYHALQVLAQYFKFMGMPIDNSLRGTSTRSVYMISSSDGLDLVIWNVCKVDPPDNEPFSVWDIRKSPSVKFKVLTN
jgi:hypothetical protein